MQTLVSIVIPVYNTKREYLEECFESIRNQTYKNIEIIVVDDGSKKDTANFLDEYCSNRPNWRVVHVENGGVSKARNRGIDDASGSYILFVDSDDKIEPGTIEECVGIVARDGSDVVTYEIAYCDETLSRVDYVQSFGSLTVDRDRPTFSVYDLDYSGKFILDQLQPQPVIKLIRRSLLVDNSIRFPEDIHIGEDHVFSLALYLKAKHISVLYKPLYKYRIFPESSMQNGYKHPTDIIKAFRAMKDVLEENKLLSQWLNGFIDFLIGNIRYNRLCYRNKPEAVEKLLRAGNELLEEIKPGVIASKLKGGDETVVGLAIEDQNRKLLDPYYRVVDDKLQEIDRLKKEIENINKATHNTSKNPTLDPPGIKQSARNLAGAVKRRIKKGLL